MANTPEGKKISARNSTRHGLLAQTVVLEEESAARFTDLFASYLEEYKPTTPSQLCLVETMAVARWRQLRVWGAQKTAMDRDMALQDPNIGPAAVRALQAMEGMELLLRYEIAFDRQFARALTRLLDLQSHSSKEPSPYHPDSPAGQTWKEIPTTKRTPD